MTPRNLFTLLPLTSACLIGAVLRLSAAEPPPPDKVVLIEHGQVDAAFAKGGPLLNTSAYKIQAGRRVAPGTVEIHAHDTDIFYIVDGAATFVTGGTPVDPKTVAPGETRADAMNGGERHPLQKGDVIVIPAGIAHQYTEVHGPFLYFVVKVTRS